MNLRSQRLPGELPASIVLRVLGAGPDFPAAPNANINPGRLPTGTTGRVIGEFRDWYLIEQPGSTGFVAKGHITLVP